MDEKKRKIYSTCESVGIATIFYLLMLAFAEISHYMLIIRLVLASVVVITYVIQIVMKLLSEEIFIGSLIPAICGAFTIGFTAIQLL